MGRNHQRCTMHKGVSLVDVIVGMAIMSIVFLALFSSFQAALEFGVRNKLRASALLLANEHLETIRALPFDSIGTVAGLPSGAIPQLETITVASTTYTRRTFIQYVDDPSDGLGAADLLAADYKRIKVELSYTYRGTTQSFALVTTVAPKAQESLVGAGVLRLVVTVADNTPLQGASVHIVNNLVATSVDITTFTNASGTVSFPGAWAGNGYEITISKAGYSSAQTYGATVANPSPSPGHASVIENSTTELYFKIDRLSTLELVARDRPEYGEAEDLFVDSSGVATSTDTLVSGGALVLADTAGVYAIVGSATSTAFTPASLGRWLMLSVEEHEPANTGVTYRIASDADTLIPDTDLPGNSVGFTGGFIDLSGLDPLTYPSLRIVAALSSDGTATPEVRSWRITYNEADVPRSGVDVNLRGAKTIGSGPIVYKFEQSVTTDGVGTWSSNTMEWDQYDVTLLTPGLVVAEACPSLPLIVDPNTTLTQVLTLAPASTDTLALTVRTHLGGTVPYAVVTIDDGGAPATRAAGPCGGAFFSGLTATTYNVRIEAPGYTPYTGTVAVNGETTEIVTLNP